MQGFEHQSLMLQRRRARLRQAGQDFQIRLLQRAPTVEIDHQPPGDGQQVGSRRRDGLLQRSGRNEQADEGILGQVGRIATVAQSTIEPSAQPSVVVLVQPAEQLILCSGSSVHGVAFHHMRMTRIIFLCHLFHQGIRAGISAPYRGCPPRGPCGASSDAPVRVRYANLHSPPWCRKSDSLTGRAGALRRIEGGDAWFLLANEPAAEPVREQARSYEKPCPPVWCPCKTGLFSAL